MLACRSPELFVAQAWEFTAENAWITLSSSTSAICAAFYRAIFDTITTSERIFCSERTARGLVPYNLPRPAISLPLDRDFKLKLFRAMRAMDDAGFMPGIISALRDDYRQSIASGNKAASDSSFHGGAAAAATATGLPSIS